MKLGVVEIPEYEITGVGAGNYLQASSLPTDGSVMLAVLVSKPGVVELRGLDRLLIAKVGAPEEVYHYGVNVNYVGVDANLATTVPSGWSRLA